MDRAELAGMLGDQTVACEPARAALLDGGDFVVWDGSVPSQQLAGIYAARLRRARKRGTETLALPSTVEILTRLEAAQVRIGCIFSPDRTWAFMLCFAADAGASSPARESAELSGDSCPAQVTTIVLSLTAAGGEVAHNCKRCACNC
ncbi:hypothetical protein ACWEQ1_34515 [Streptomyces nodosus]